MGINSSLPGGARVLRKQVEHGDTRAVLGAVREDPRLFTAHCFPGSNGLMHVVARYGQSTMLGALIDEIRDMQARAAEANAAISKEGHQLAGQSNQGPARHAHTQGVQSSQEVQQPAQARQQGAVPAVGEEHQVVLHSAEPQHQHTSSRQLGKWSGSRPGCGAPGCVPWLRLASNLDIRSIVDSVNARKQTPLIIAASRGHTDVARKLLELGANPLAADRSEGCTALHYAAMYGHVETVRLLLTCPALSQQQQQPQQQQQGPDAQLTPGATGSTSSTSDGDQHMLRKQLLAMVSDVGASALHFAADAGHVDVVRLLLTFGADILQPMRPPRWVLLALHTGATALHLAAEQGHLQVALSLLKNFMDRSTAAANSGSPAPVDPRTCKDAGGLRPHQVAFMNQQYRLALILRPSYPLRWLFDTPPAAATTVTVPKLTTLAAQALRLHLSKELEAAAAESPEPSVAAGGSGAPKLGKDGSGSGKPGRLGRLGEASSVRPSSGRRLLHLMATGLGAGSTASTPRDVPSMVVPHGGGAAAWAVPQPTQQQQDEKVQGTSVLHQSGTDPVTALQVEGEDSVREAAATAGPSPDVKSQLRPQGGVKRQAMPDLNLGGGDAAGGEGLQGQCSYMTEVTEMGPANDGCSSPHLTGASQAPEASSSKCGHAGMPALRLSPQPVSLASCSSHWAKHGAGAGASDGDSLLTAREVLLVDDQHQGTGSSVGPAHVDEQQQDQDQQSLRAGVQALLALMQQRPNGVSIQGQRSSIQGSQRSSLGVTPDGAPHGILASAAVSRQLSDSEDVSCCDVCFEEGALLQIRPCAHVLCVGCARRMCAALTTQPMLCPFCRTCVAGFKRCAG